MLLLFGLVPASAGENPTPMFASEEPGAPHDPGDVVMPVEEPAAVSSTEDTGTGLAKTAAPDLRPPGFKTYMEDTAIWYGAQWAA
ncbi:MAG: hypothetical protein F9K51_04355, partial [Candidatus Dadabacteria bacterium]